MKILKVLGIILASVVVLLLVLYLVAPKEAYMERTTFIDAPPAQVYQVVNNYHEFNAWNPWYELDSTSEVSYEGPVSGVGSKYSWESDTLGNGSMWIVETVPSTRVSSRMKFEGYSGEPYAIVKLEPEKSGTRVTWSYEEKSTGMYRIGNLFDMVDKMIGPQFERGLEKLKGHVEDMDNSTSGNMQEEPEETSEMESPPAQ